MSHKEGDSGSLQIVRWHHLTANFTQYWMAPSFIKMFYDVLPTTLPVPGEFHLRSFNLAVFINWIFPMTFMSLSL